MFYLIYNEVFYKPLLNGLVYITAVIPFHDVGFAVIILTLIVKIILFPLTHKSVKTQIKIKEIEPALKRAKEGISDRQKQAEEILRIYKEHGISPYSGVFMLLIQLPILIALYTLFWKGLSFDGDLYSFVNIPKNINLKFLGIFDITQRSVFFAFLSGISQFLQIHLATPKIKSKENSRDFSAVFAKQMKFFMPAVIFIIALKLPAAVSIYWTTMNIFAIVHEGIVRRKI